MKEVIPIIIPSYEPDERFIELLKKLREVHLEPIIVVNDGSSRDYDYFFNIAQRDYNVRVLTHEVNMGKGRALKTAFAFCIENYPEMLGTITADSDGQHTRESIFKVREQLKNEESALILGVRNFECEGIPEKSRFGNNFTRKVFRFFYKKDITDTQTGLRGIPKMFMRILLSVEGERFEFETRMLVKAVEDKIKIVEVPIETIYDSKENHATHFQPIKDSIRIYKVFSFSLGKFLISSLSSSVIDIVFFQLFCLFLRQSTEVGYVFIATIVARIISAIYNYSVNYYLVFRSKKKHIKTALKYFVLSVFQMICSGLFTAGFILITEIKVELLVKIPVDIVLFFLSYQIQKRLIY